MAELLRVLKTAVPALVDDGCRTIESEGRGSMGNAVLTIERGSLIWRVVRDRSQVFLECRWVDGRPDRWFTIDLLRSLVSGEVVKSAVLDEDNARWLSNHLSDVESSFEPETVEESQRRLGMLKADRAKRLFG